MHHRNRGIPGFSTVPRGSGIVIDSVVIRSRKGDEKPSKGLKNEVRECCEILWDVVKVEVRGENNTNFYSQCLPPPKSRNQSPKGPKQSKCITKTLQIKEACLQIKEDPNLLPEIRNGFECDVILRCISNLGRFESFDLTAPGVRRHGRGDQLSRIPLLTREAIGLISGDCHMTPKA